MVAWIRFRICCNIRRVAVISDYNARIFIITNDIPLDDYVINS